MCAVTVVAAREIDDDRHDLAQRQGRRAGTLALSAPQSPVRVERCKPLAKVVDIAAHGNELAHRDLRRVQTAAWSIPPPDAGPYGLTSPSRVSRIQVS